MIGDFIVVIAFGVETIEPDGHVSPNTTKLLSVGLLGSQHGERREGAIGNTTLHTNVPFSQNSSRLI